MSDFDSPVDRRGSDSYKWDGAGAVFHREGLLPFWVADMDFRTPAPIVEAVRRRAEHPVFGYERRSEESIAAVREWLERRHGWIIEREWLMFCPPSSIVAMYGLVDRLTKPGDSVACHVPGYHPLFQLVEDNERQLLRCPMIERDGRYVVDVADMSTRIRDDTRLLLLCNPHNPTGRVLTEEELAGVAALAAERDMVVVSDEVHADLVMPGYRHLPFGKVRPERSVTVISPNKTFNTAGLPQSSLVIPDPELRRAFARFLDTLQLNHDSTFGVTAMVAAYRHCGGWLDELIEYVAENHRYLGQYLAERVPQISAAAAEGTYLAWLDFRRIGLSEEELQRRLVDIGGVGLYAGTQFGREGSGFFRMNVACPRSQLERGLEGMERALNGPG